MRLKRLLSNKTSFHTVEFKPGINLIVGSATKKNKTNTQKTYNGVGKSLLIKLVDFCLACDAVQEFSDKLDGWQFSLEFEVNGKQYISTRSTASQQKITLNGEEISIGKFREIFLSKIFDLSEPVNFLTWRTLISRFIRPRKESYVRFDTVTLKDTPYAKLINTAFLLGLDIDLIQKKKGLKAELDRIENFKSNLGEDEIFKKYFTHDKDVDIEAAELEDKIHNLTKILESFKVSDSYYEIQQEADRLKFEGQQLKNRMTVMYNSVKSIDKTLEIKSDITVETIVSLYNETKSNLPDSVKKTLTEVSNFHASLLKKRFKRLSTEKERIVSEIKNLEEKRKEIGDQLDERLQYLGKHKALDEFVAINMKLANLTGNLSKLKGYKGLLQEYQNKSDAIGITFKEENIKTNNYLAEASSLIEKNINTFRLLSKRFYSDKAGGIEVKQNKGINQIRFDIDVQIDDDTSDGVNEVKIFCFDLTLLLTRHTHAVHFILHDSRLFSNIDPRQRATLFRLCYEYSTEKEFQYIATVNEDQIESVKKYYSADEYEEIITKSRILNLTDESDSFRLLGEHINVDYEK